LVVFSHHFRSITPTIMDALSDVLKFLRLEGAVYLNAEFTAPWCIRGNAASRA